MRSVLLAALLAAGSAHADLIASSGKNELRLMPAACEDAGILERIQPEHHAKFHKGQADLFVAFSDGDAQAFPITIFRDEPGV